jgi:hypothetical protein
VAYSVTLAVLFYSETHTLPDSMRKAIIYSVIYYSNQHLIPLGKDSP